LYWFLKYPGTALYRAAFWNDCGVFLPLLTEILGVDATFFTPLTIFLPKTRFGAEHPVLGFPPNAHPIM